MNISPSPVRSHIVMSLMHDGLGGSGSDVSQREIEYYATRAKDGMGDFRPNGLQDDMAYMRQVVPLLVSHGVDLVNVSMGGIDCMPNPNMVAGYRDAIIQNIKDVVDVPVVAVNCLT